MSEMRTHKNSEKENLRKCDKGICDYSAITFENEELKAEVQSLKNKIVNYEATTSLSQKTIADNAIFRKYMEKYVLNKGLVKELIRMVKDKKIY